MADTIVLVLSTNKTFMVLSTNYVPTSIVSMAAVGPMEITAVPPRPENPPLKTSKSFHGDLTAVPPRQKSPSCDVETLKET